MAADTRSTPGSHRRTELRHSAGPALDGMTTFDILTLMNDEDAVAVQAARRALVDLAPLVTCAADLIRAGGAVHYFGAGTSGRLGILDASELRPTFNLPEGVVVAHIAGGPSAVTDAIEGAEDSWDEGKEDASQLGRGDMAIGLAASGSTPYVGGALDQARRLGAATALIACNPSPELAPLADVVIVADTGPEVLAGSTRLKAGTAEKILLNGFSTALMIALGQTWGGLMVSVVATNEKLVGRTAWILAETLNVDAETAVALLASADGDLKAAIVSGRANVGLDQARHALEMSHGSVAAALDVALRDGTAAPNPRPQVEN